MPLAKSCPESFQDPPPLNPKAHHSRLTSKHSPELTMGVDRKRPTAVPQATRQLHADQIEYELRCHAYRGEETIRLSGEGGRIAQIRYVCEGDLWPHPNDVDVISHWNGQMCRTETCADLEEAQRRGWEWHKALVHGPQPKLAPRHPAADLRLFRSPLLR